MSGSSRGSQNGGGTGVLQPSPCIHGCSGLTEVSPCGSLSWASSWDSRIPGPQGAEPMVNRKEFHLVPQGASLCLSLIPQNSVGPERPGLWAPSLQPPGLQTQAGAGTAREGPTSRLWPCCWKPRWRRWDGLRAEIPGNELQTRHQGSQSMWTGAWVSAKGNWTSCREAIKTQLPSYQRDCGEPL